MYISNSYAFRSLLIITSFFLTTCTDDNPTAPEIDHVSPVIEWLSPSANADLAGTVELSFSVEDENTVSSIKIYRNGSVPDGWTLSAQESETYSLDWDTEEVEDGLYTLEVRATDDSGNLGISPALQVRVVNDTDAPIDRLSPLIEWLSPRGDSKLSGEIELSFSIFDSGGVVNVSLYRNGFTASSWTQEVTVDSVYTLSWNTEIVDDGVYSLEVRAKDASGNLGISPALVVRVANDPESDRLPPDVWWTAPEAGSTQSDTVTLTLRVFDEVGVDSVALYKNGSLSSSGVPAGGEYSYVWNTASDSDGVYVWEARAWDSSGNVGLSASLLLRVRNHEPPIEDRTPPLISWLSPEPGTEVEGLVQLRAMALDDDDVETVSYFINGSQFADSLVQRNNHEYRMLWDTAQEDDGLHIISVTALDRSGNGAVSPAIALTVYNNRPRVIWVPDDYETIQDAIWASEDGDTIMVRAGTYHEQLQFLDKNVSLVSEDGPEETIIDGTGYWAVVYIGGGQDSTTMIRGFTFTNPSDFQGYCFSLDGVSTKIVNNILTVPNSDGYGIINGFVSTQIRNNLFIDLEGSGDMASSWGVFENNMIANAVHGMHNASRGQPLVPDYNLLWNVDDLYGGREMGWGDNNIEGNEPQFENGSYRLQEDSPGVNQGNPEIEDLDGSRSDIGVYGGPYAYE